MTARLPDISTLLQAGINPATGMPAKINNCTNYKDVMKRILRVTDEQDAINRYKWFNLPSGMTGQLLERILYYKGQGAFFYMKANETFYFLPYALDGTIDVYGRFMGITPLPFGNGQVENEKGKIKPWINGLNFKPVYEIILPDELEENDMYDKCVLLHDYCKQISQTVIPRQQLNEGLLDIESDIIPFMRTALLSGTGISGIKVNSTDEQSNVEAASIMVNNAALNGKKWVSILGGVEFQELTGANLAKVEEFTMAMQTLDNIRLGTYGLENGGLFEKKAHMLESENSINDVNVGLVYQDGLTLRQEFCNIVNSIWGLGIWCDSSEVVSNADKNGDGMMEDGANDMPNEAEGDESYE